MHRPILPLLLFPALLVGQSTPASSVSTNGAMTCGMLRGRALCWGHVVPAIAEGARPRPDPATGIPMWPPAPIPGDPGFVTIAVGGGRTACGLTGPGELWCVGQNSRHPMGPFTEGSGAENCGGLTCAPRPVRVAAPLRFKAFANGHQTACGVTLEGRLYCWGLNEEGQVGVGRGRAVTRPVALAPTLRFMAVGTSDYHGCALTDAGEAWCWGSADGTQVLGNGDPADAPWRPGPQRVRTTQRFISLSVAYQVSCALTPEGQAWCWGWNDADWLGVGPAAECMGGGRDCLLVPMPVAGETRFREFKVGNGAACGITRAGMVHCLGRGGAAAPGVTPRMAARTIGTNAALACAVAEEDEVYCWGNEFNGPPTPHAARRVFPPLE